MMRKLLIPLAVVAVSAAACAQLGSDGNAELGQDLSYDPATAPMPVLASVSSSSSSSGGRFGGLKVVPADKVFRDGETSREYDGQVWVCGNPGCTVAVPQQTSPAPHARDKPRF